MIIEPTYYFDETTAISPEFLKNTGAKVILIDIDNTLVTYGEAVPNEKVIKWLDALKNADLKVCLISNNTTKRVSTFAENLDIFYIANASKPFSGCVKKAMKKFSVESEDLILIGDQIYTDILCACFTKIKSILVKPLPYKENLFFKIKRGNEKPIIKKFMENHPDKCFFGKDK